MRNCTILKFGLLALLATGLLILPGCKKKEDTVSGTWRGTVTLDIAHQHEEFQTWTEIITNPDGTTEEIEHQEHISYSLTDTINMEFQFTIQPPLYDARIEGEGTATQSVTYFHPGQCSLSSLSAPDFKFNVFGTVNSSTFSIKLVPKTVPQLLITQQCQNIQLRMPVYNSILLNIIDNINLDIQAEDGITVGDSGVTTVGSPNAPISYIYNITLNQN